MRCRGCAVRPARSPRREISCTAMRSPGGMGVPTGQKLATITTMGRRQLPFLSLVAGTGENPRVCDSHGLRDPVTWTLIA